MRLLSLNRINTVYFILFCLGVLTSLVTIYAFHFQHIPFDYQGDSGKYIKPALGLLNHGQYGKFYNGVFYPELERLPFYPLLIYFSYMLFGSLNNFSVVLVQALLMGGLVVVVVKSVSLINPRFVWVAGILTALCPNLFVRSALILPDLLFVFFVAWGLYFLFLSLQKKFLSNYILAFVLFGCAFMTRPAFLFYPIITSPFLIYLLCSKKKIGVARSCGFTLLSLGILILMVTPQLVREKHYAKGYMLSVQTGVHSLYWIYPCLETRWGGKINVAARKHADELYQKKLSAIPANADLSPAQVVHLQSHLAASLIISIPLEQLIRATVGSSLKLLFYTSFLGAAEAFHHHIPHVSTSLHDYKKTLSDLLADPWQVVILLSQLFIFLLRGLQILGLVYGILKKEYRAITLYLFSGTLSFVAVSVGLGNPRYRVPIEPELIIFSVLGMIAIYSYLKDRAINRKSFIPAMV